MIFIKFSGCEGHSSSLFFTLSSLQREEPGEGVRVGVGRRIGMHFFPHPLFSSLEGKGFLFLLIYLPAEELAGL